MEHKEAYHLTRLLPSSLKDGDVHRRLGTALDVVKSSESPLILGFLPEGIEDSSVQIVANGLQPPPIPSPTQGANERKTEC